MKKILAALATAIVAAVGVLVTPEVVAWFAIVLGLGVVGGITASGILEVHKRVFIRPPSTMTRYGKPIPQRDYWHTEQGKTCIRLWALGYGWLFTAVGGVVCWLLIAPGTLNDRQVFAVVVLWGLWSTLVGATLPAAYRFAKRYLVPLLVRRVTATDEPSDTGDDETVVPDELRRKNDVA